jgi:hypothetical protein
MQMQSENESSTEAAAGLRGAVQIEITGGKLFEFVSLGGGE